MNAMYFSIENRSPFLDRQLFELAHTIPTKHLIREGRGKAILRDAMEGIVIPEILTETRKVGFNAPILELFDLSDTKNIEFLLDDSNIYNFIKKEKIENLIKKDELKNSESKFLFNVLNVKIMYDCV
jgi:asparagine synthase (glutamine-hydrolysing)